MSSFSVVSYDEDRGMLEVENSDNIPGITDSSINISATRFTRSSSEHTKSFTKLCFVCQEVRPCEENRYNQGGIGRREQSSSASRIKESMKEPLKNGDAKFYKAAKRVDLLLSGSSHDIYSADIFYHQSCYRNFVREQKLKTVDGDSQDETNLMNDFFRFIRLNIIKNENAYLLTQLLSDWKSMCDGRGVSSVITHSSQIRKRIEEEFPNDINFFPSGRNVIVHNTTMNPCRYSVATLQGAGLRDLDISKGFAATVRRKME